MNKEEIKDWLSKYEINNYTINDDLTVDVHHDGVYVDNMELTEFPFQFGTINGYFSFDSNHLTSLKNCPKVVRGNFSCYMNNLTSLEHCPKVVHGYFWCDEHLEKDPRYLRWLLAHKLSQL